MGWLLSRSAWPRKRSGTCTEPKHSTTKVVSCIAAVNMGRSCERNFHFSVQVLLKCYPFNSTWCYRLTFPKQLQVAFFGARFKPEVQKSWLTCACTTEIEDSSELCSWKLYSICVWGSGLSRGYIWTKVYVFSTHCYGSRAGLILTGLLLLKSGIYNTIASFCYSYCI